MVYNTLRPGFLLQSEAAVFTSLQDVRREFPVLQEKIFFDSAGVGIAPIVAADAIRKFLDSVTQIPVRSMVEHHMNLEEARERARPEAARLINASEDEIALIESTTHGLAIAARALPLESGDNIVTADLEFIEVPLAWRQKETGICPEIRLARNREGTLPPSAFEEQIDSRTRAVVVSSVQWCNGYRCDLEELGKLCKRSGILLIVDAIQQLGAFRLDASQHDADIVICGGHKWLNAPFGAGFLYIRREVWNRLKVPVAGYMSMSPLEGDWGQLFQSPESVPLQPLTMSRTARQFENGGTANYPGGIGLAASLRMINELGHETIEKHIRGITDHLMSGLKALPLRLVTPEAASNRSGIVVFDLGKGAQKNIELKEFLLDQKILTSVRYTSGVGGLRVSCHFYNTIEDVDCLLNQIDSRISI
jgi:cysteine desulfurase/selenocysteine lyase